MECLPSLEVLNYKACERGWAVLEIGAVDAYETITTCFECDSLTDMMNASIRLLSKQSQFELVYFYSSSTTHELLFTIIGNHLRIEVFHDGAFESIVHYSHRIVPVPILTIYSKLHEFCQLLIKTAKSLLDKLGMEGYKEWWHRDFPDTELRELEALCKI